MKDDVPGMSEQTDIQKDSVKELNYESKCNLNYYRPLLKGERLLDTEHVMATWSGESKSERVMIYFDDRAAGNITKWLRLNEKNALEFAQNILKKYAEGKDEQTA
jgi:hypothetical protein